MKRTFRRIGCCKALSFAAWFAVWGACLEGAETEDPIDSGPYLRAVARFADCVVSQGTDTYGKEETPLFVDGLNASTLEPAKWLGPRNQVWIPSNFANQQSLMRTLDGLTLLTDEPKYRNAAENAARYALQHLQTPNGLLYWGGHFTWDLEQEAPVGQYPDIHELKGHQPYYQLMWRVAPAETRRLMEAIWAAHVLDWSRLDYNRHASSKSQVRPQWDHEFKHDVEVPFPTKDGNLSFCNVTPPLMHAGVMLSVLGEDKDSLRWTQRLAERWQQARHPRTGLCGGQLSYRKPNRAHDTLGHVHPEINEAKIVASFHQLSRYHHLPLAQMQAAETLLKVEGDCADLGHALIEWAADDLKVYARHCYDHESGLFLTKLTDGTPLRWQEAKTGYYDSKSLAPRPPDGYLVWGYAMAYRLTRDPEHWQVVAKLGSHLELGECGEPEGKGRSLKLDTAQRDWRLIYALLEMQKATGDLQFLRLACHLADNVLKMQTPTGLFVRAGREYGRTGDEIPLALLHLTAAIDGKRSLLPQAMFDNRLFHCQYHGPLQDRQQKHNWDLRTDDALVYFGPD